MNHHIRRFSSNINSDSAHLIAIAGGLPGSSLASNLAICLANRDKKVCVLQSADMPPVKMLSSQQHSLPTWKAVMDGVISVEQLVQQGPADFHVIPQSTRVNDYSTLDTRQRQNLLLAFTQLQYDYDFLLIDRTAGFNAATTSFLLGAGSIILTITPDAKTLENAFSLLKGVNQRVFQQPVRVIVNIVAGQIEAKQIISRLGIAVRKYLGVQCGSLSFYIMDKRMLNIISDARLVMLEFPHSLPAHCLEDIALKFDERGQAAESQYSEHLSEPETGSSRVEVARKPYSAPDEHWLSEAIQAIQLAPIEVIEPIMQKLNDIWQQRTRLLADKRPQPSSFELEILKLKTAIHFASHVSDKPSQKEH